MPDIDSPSPQGFLKLIVVGTKGRGSLARRVPGSTSYKLTHHARLPVLVVPPD